MENLRPLKYITLTLLVVLLPQATFAYHTNTHSQLTKQTIEAYNTLNSERELTAKDIKNITEGSVDEDDGKRPLRHFYDPINGQGLFGVNMAAHKWAEDTLAQANYGWNNLEENETLFSDATDYSWDRAVYEYNYGDRDRAMQTLGHILHLVQDASVPAHVRNDDHLSKWGWGDINLYEEYTTKREPSVTVTGIKDFNSLDDIYKDLAKFTNENFLSKDTIFEGYILPRRKGLRLERSMLDGDTQYFGVGDFGKLVLIDRIKDWKVNNYVETYVIDDKEQEILANYYKILSNKAAEYGVATIDLFFREVEMEQKVASLKYMNKSQDDIDSIANAITGFGTVKSLLGSSLSAVDAYELNREDWEGARRTAAIYGIGFPPRPEGESAIAKAESEPQELQKTKLPKPSPIKQIERTIIKGTESGVNEIITPAQQVQRQEPNYEQMGAALLAMEKLLKQLMLRFQKSDKCAGIDLGIMKFSTCLDPYEEGGYAYGAGGAGISSGPLPPWLGGPPPVVWNEQ